MPAPSHRTSSANPSTPAIVLALALLVLLVAGGFAMVQTIRMVPGSAVAGKVVAQAKQRAAVVPAELSKPLFAGPGWELMTRKQKLALYPLAERWDYMTNAQKRRWLALAETFSEMPEKEQQRLHERMGSWAGLSAQQRSQARLNFATAKELSPDDVQELWEAYQALTDAQRNRLAATAPKPRGAATAFQPVPSKRLAHVPAPSFEQSQSPNPPKIVFPASTAVREPAPAAPVELAPAPAAALDAQADSAPVRDDPSSDPDAARPSDPLPPLYIN